MLCILWVVCGSLQAEAGSGEVQGNGGGGGFSATGLGPELWEEEGLTC